MENEPKSIGLYAAMRIKQSTRMHLVSWETQCTLNWNWLPCVDYGSVFDGLMPMQCIRRVPMGKSQTKTKWNDCGESTLQDIDFGWDKSTCSINEGNHSSRNYSLSYVSQPTGLIKPFGECVCYMIDGTVKTLPKSKQNQINIPNKQTNKPIQSFWVSTL